MPRPILWLILALPAAYILGSWTFVPDSYGRGHAIADSGDWAAWLLMATLAITPIRLLLGARAMTRWLLVRRRDLGVASFAYAAGHTIVYLWNKGAWEWIVADLDNTYIIAGWVAFALFVPLAITSTDRAVRRLKGRWKVLHRLVYPAAVLTFLHWVWSAFDPTVAWINVGILATIEILRLVLQVRQMRARKPSS